MNTDGFFGQKRSLICPPRRAACSEHCGTLLTYCVQAALSTRDLARTSQQKQEVSLLSEGKDRDKKLSEHRSLELDACMLCFTHASSSYKRRKSIIADEIIRYLVVQIKSTMKIFYATFKQCSRYAKILNTPLRILLKSHKQRYLDINNYKKERTVHKQYQHSAIKL